MTFLTERLAELRRHLDHLSSLRERAPSAEDLARNLSLHNDVLFSLLSVSQLVIDIAGELNSRRGMRFDDYTQAVRNLAAMPEFDAEMVGQLARLPGFRNVVVHEYVGLDLQQAVNALEELEPVYAFLRTATGIEGRQA